MTSNALLNWMMLSTVLLGAWWLCYHLALRRERSFGYNRLYLVAGPLLAASLPLLPLAWPAGWGEAPALPGLSAVLLPTVQVGAAETAAAPDRAAWLLAAYGLGAAVLLARLAAGLGQLWWRARRLPAEPGPGYCRLRTGGRLPSSSFGRWIFWDDTLPLSPLEAQQVLRHELAHVRQGHTYDHLLLELLRAALWFNPFVHLCGRALTLTHEFLADEAALRPEPAEAVAAPAPARAYTHLLARQATMHLGFAAPLAHSFFHSPILTRIAMIHQTSPVRRWKQWLVLPLFGVLFTTAAFAQQQQAGKPGKTIRLKNLSDGKVKTVDVPRAAAAADTTPPPPPVLDTRPVPANQKVYTYVEQMPQLPGGGGNAAIVAAIQRQLKYPTGAGVIDGRVFVSFIVAETGDVNSVTVVKRLSEAQDAAVVAAVQQLPRFVPGRQNAKVVAVTFTVPVQFGPDKARK